MTICMESYSMDLRKRVVRACDEQIGTRVEIAEMFGVSTAWIRRLLQRRRETGDFSARPRGGRRFGAFDEAGLERLKSLGYLYVALDLAGFRSGSLNAPLKHVRGESR